MATTTNYGWTTPDDTNLVKNGASDIRTLANAIDSTVKTNDNNAVKATIIDAKGDLLAGTAADTISRLAVGSNGQLLRANSSTATGLEWATITSGGYVQLATGSMASASSVSLTGLGGYKEIWVYCNGVTHSASAYSYTTINNDTGSNYNFFSGGQGGGVSWGGWSSPTSCQFTDTNGAAWSGYIHFVMADRAQHKLWEQRSYPTGTNVFVGGYGINRTSAVLSSVEIRMNTGTFSAGTYTVWGVN